MPQTLVAISKLEHNAPNIRKKAYIVIVVMYNTKKLMKNCAGVLAIFVIK
jgi:hypothetical protein